MSAQPWVTYRRADGDEIFGEYSFVCEPDGLDDCDEGAMYVKETWQLMSAEDVWYGPPERLQCEACEGSGLLTFMPPVDCPVCEGEGTVEPPEEPG